MAGLIDYKEQLANLRSYPTQGGKFENVMADMALSGLRYLLDIAHTQAELLKTQNRIADSLEKLVAAQKPKWIELTIPADRPYKRTFRNDWLGPMQWLSARNETVIQFWNGSYVHVAETPDEIKALIAAALGSAEDKAGDDKN